MYFTDPQAAAKVAQTTKRTMDKPSTANKRVKGNASSVAKSNAKQD